ncbi:YbaB/EbfC family nucleoid-associated protein [bacterium]|nr:YbaB/EbfC family nucleoid-associated protein [bacterium]
MNMKKMLKEAQRLQQKMQEDMDRASEQLEGERIEGSSGGGLVTVVVNGHKQIVSVQIKKEAVDPEDVETLEDLVFAAAQSALSAAEARNNEVMEAVQSASMPTGIGGMLGM